MQVRRLAHRAPAAASRASRRPTAPVDEELIDAGDREPHLRRSTGSGAGGAARRSSRRRSTLEFLLRRGVPRMPEKTLDAMAAGGMYDLRRRRLPPLLGRPALARAALREDAVRQRAARRLLPPRLAGDRQGALPDGRRADDRLHAARARARGRRLRLVAGRRHRRQGGADLHLDAHGGRFPDELLHSFEGGRFVLRGELDEATRRQLFELREQRPKPARDDKAVASWNGLALAALAECGRVLGRADWVEAARALGEFLLGPLSTRGRAAAPHLARRASRRAPATSRTTPTSRTGCSSCTPRPASCAGSRRRTGSRGSRSSSSPTRRTAASSRRRPTASSSSCGKKIFDDHARAERELDARLRAAAALADLRRRRARGEGACRCSSSMLGGLAERAVVVRLGARRGRPLPRAAAGDRDRGPPDSEVAKKALRRWDPHAVIAFGPVRRRAAARGQGRSSTGSRRCTSASGSPARRR